MKNENDVESKAKNESFINIELDDVTKVNGILN
jgi:hypothetical protein